MQGNLKSLSIMKRIFFFTSSLPYGGKERQTAEMLKQLSDYYKITLFIMNQTKYSFTDTFGEIKFDFRFLCPESKNIFRRFAGFYQVIKSGRPHLIYTMDAISAYFSFIPSWYYRIPLINGCIRHAGVTHSFDYYFEKISLLLSDYVVSNSRAGLRHYHLDKSSKASVIYNFIDSSRFRKSERLYSVLVMTANFTLYKDHKTILECAERLFAEKKIQMLYLIGDGPNLEKCKLWVNDRNLHEKIVFLGKVTKVEEVLEKCFIGILCSTRKYKEGISNSILEYMGSGLLAIASDLGGTSEIIENGTNGLLFEAENPESLYNCIIWALDHPIECKKMINNAISTVETKFSGASNRILLQKVFQKFI